MKSSIIKFEALDSKESIRRYAKTIRQMTVRGNNDPLMVAKQLKSLELLVKELKADKIIKECIIEEYEKYNEKNLHIHGCNFLVKESGVKYDFSNCNHARHMELSKEIDKLLEERKTIETMLKQLPQDGLADPATGEMWYPPSKTSTDAINIKLDV